jgi:hypothetical protein
MKLGFRKTNTQKTQRENMAKLALLALLAVLNITVNTAQAGDCDPILYGTSYQGQDGLATLYTINLANGAATSVGPTGFERISAIDIDPTSDTMYAIAERPSDDQKVLISINRITGAGTQVAEVTLNPVSGREHIAGMSFNNSGALYGFVDVSDGSVLELNESDLGLSGNGLAFSPGGVLYHADSSDLNTINLATGLLVQHRVLTFNFPWDLPKVAAMDYASDSGLYYAIVKDGPDGEAFLTTVDVTTGNVDSIGATADFMDGLTYSCGTAVQIPDIEIEKATNGLDADFPSGPTIEVGQPVTWTYVVTNTGQVSLNNIAVNDDVLGSISCPRTSLAPAESMTCSANGTAVAGQYVNNGDVSGTPPEGPPVTDSDRSHYLGVELTDEVFKDGFETLITQ